jgi:fibrillarin-like pre-rRNA processing protein
MRKIINEHKFFGVYEIDKGRKKILTKNLTPKKTFFDEATYKEGREEYRLWDPSRSKLAAAIMKDVSQIGIKPKDVVLYLGASHGYTPSFLSDIVGEDGIIFALDFAPRVVRDLVMLAEKRKNIVPILADCKKPQTYVDRVILADVVYQDIAQKNQVEIFLKNCNMYLKKDGFALLCVKARSVDVTKKPAEIFNKVRTQLEDKIIIVDYRKLDPFEKDHCIFVCKKK